MKAFATCQICGEQIELKQKKDFESYTKHEALVHFREKHPEVLLPIPVGMPYTPVTFEKESK